MPSVADALRWAHAEGVDRLDAQLLLAHLLQRPRSWVIAHDDAPLEHAPWQQVEALLRRRAAGVPLAHLIGEKGFHTLVLQITRDVLVPRPDTEVLVNWALELLPTLGTRPRVLDLGTGSGAIALAIAQSHPGAIVSAVEASPAALSVARGNGARLGLAVEWLAGDWFEPMCGRRFELIVANPPYVAESDPHLPALRHEPRSALVAGADGLGDLRRIAAAAPDHLVDGGWLLLEHGHEQAEAVQRLLREQGLRDIATRRDLAGLPRCSGGRATAPPSR
jgi:release factor glutamine methyltransferase